MGLNNSPMHVNIRNTVHRLHFLSPFQSIAQYRRYPMIRMFKKQKHLPFFINTVLLFTLFLFVVSTSCKPSHKETEGIENGNVMTEILWDKWGVPHIFARDTAELFYAFGWAQMQNHGDLILKLYGEARGKASEYWGEANLPSDKTIRTMGIPQRSKEWLKAYSPEFQKYLNAFAGGMNDYAAKHPDEIDKQRQLVLPVSAEDVLGHTQRLLYLYFLGSRAELDAANWEKAGKPVQAGSNAWAIAPSHSQDGNSMLLTNPHLPWFDFFLFFESHLSAPGVNAYGVTFVGLPMHIMAFNPHLGWSHTVNVNDGADLFELKIEKDGYRLDGQIKNFRTETQSIKIKNEDGSFREQELTIQHSIFGPVTAKKGDRALSLRIAGLDQPLIWEQRFDMARATNLKEFKTALKRVQVPMLNIIYADRDGHIMAMHNAVLPKRSSGDWDFWSGIVPGDRSEMLWTEYHPYSDLPKVIDPPNGWVQNVNQPIWSCTHPMTIKPGDYTDYVTRPIADYSKFSNMAFRTLRSIRMLSEDKKISFDELIKYKHSTRMEMADRILDDLLNAVKTHGNAGALEAAKVLEAWDRCAEADSRGAVLFEAWVKEMKGQIFAKEWQADSPFTTPAGLKDPKAAAIALESAANITREKHGALDVPWGDVYRIKYGGKDLPANGGSGRLGIFRSMYFYPDQGTLNMVSGDCYVAAVEFSNPVKAKVVLGYGNATQPHSKHCFDQIELMAQKKLRPALLTRSEILEHLEKKESFPEKTKENSSDEK
jgi:acyl-homoserine-lactone acylase